MTPDDARHGQSAGYVAGCREECCRAAMRIWTRKARARRYLHGPLTVPSLGTIRRIHALMALGWSTRQLDAHLGKKRTYTNAVLLSGDYILRSTAALYGDLYERLSMRLPPQTKHYERQIVSRMRNYAKKMGWLPPLAWDDPDDPDERPTRGRANFRDDPELDEQAIWRRMHGDKTVRLTKADAAEVVERCLAAGWAWDRIEKRTGINVERHKERRAG